jgi:CheY-like chemotaxis protein
LPAVAAEETQIVESHAPAPETELRPLRILAVDDDSLVLFNTAAMLDDMGHVVVEAGSGEEALAALRKENFDLVITDQVMPRMTGVELMQAIEREWPGLPVILATGYAELPHGVQVKAPMLNKPFTEADLAEVLKAAMT